MNVAARSLSPCGKVLHRCNRGGVHIDGYLARRGGVHGRRHSHLEISA